MNLEEAIKTALEFEGKVHRTYVEAKQSATSDVARRTFEILCEEEMGHIQYLKERLDEWKETGKVTVAQLGTAVPSREAIQAGVAKLKDRVAGEPARGQDVELESLKRALQVEGETAAFYRKMVETLDAEGQQLFERFVEIEEGHEAIVQAEIDSVTGSGFWFDMGDIRLESG